MKTGLESLDTGAPEITYSGNQGPKSPQEDQQKMAEFQLQEYMEEFERVFPDMKDKRGTPDYMKELQDYFEGLASKQSEGIGDIAMKSGLIDEYRNYKMGQEDAGQPVMSPRDYYRSLEQDRMGVKEGGVMQLVKENENGSRPGYRGDDAARSSEGTSAGRADPGAGAGYGDGPSSEDRRQTYSATQFTNPTKSVINAVTDPDLALQQNLNQAKAIINARLEPTSFNKVIRKIPSPLLKVLIPSPKKKMAIARKNDLLRDLYKVNQTGEMLTPEFFDTEEGEQYLRDAGVYDGPDLGNNKDGPPIILPPVIPTTGMIADATDPEELGTEFTSQFTRNELTDADKERISNIGGKSIFLADGGRASYADGGITDLRQGYFLGKLVKKATRGLKKVFKSPIAQAALLAGGGYFARNLIPGGVINGKNKTGFIANLFNKLLRQKDASDLYSSFDPFKVGILGASALTGLYAKQDQDDEPTLDEYMGSASRGPGMDPRGIREYIAMNKGNINPMDYSFLNPSYYAADGGRIGYAMGGIGNLRGALSKEMFNLGEDEEDEIKKLAMGGSAGMPPVTMQPGGQDAQSFGDDESTGIAQATPTTTLPNQMPIKRPMMDPRMMQMMAQKENSMMGRGMMQQPRIMAQEGGMMDMGGMEKDYRNEGGFVPIGGQERADDVPARLSKNEFVFTADAVRNAGGGDIDKGAEIMENMMENLEAGGKVSKGSQGLSGAREMFATQQRLGEVL